MAAGKNWGIPMTKPDHDTELLDGLFKTARSDEQAAARPDLLARVLADAEALQPQFEPLQRKAPKKSLFAQLSGALGGWPSLTGLAAAAVAGVWIGFTATPDLFPNGIVGIGAANTEIYLAYLEGDDSYGLEE